MYNLFLGALTVEPAQWHIPIPHTICAYPTSINSGYATQSDDPLVISSLKNITNSKS